ncbi:hypothetical protein CEXT_548601 [Caerostris extrusa]|uniref:Uncharacterized protein n=1 Tax=Caerostris extrusa TaxID=172846 RepID=A0AAV4U1N2_CAEEX|nr:hypothetical protein CEXT_548601 [Caerostris extrusa]
MLTYNAWLNRHQETVEAGIAPSVAIHPYVDSFILSLANLVPFVKMWFGFRKRVVIQNRNLLRPDLKILNLGFREKSCDSEPQSVTTRSEDPEVIGPFAVMCRLGPIKCFAPFLAI